MKDYSREGVGRQRGPQQGSKDTLYLFGSSGIEFPTRGKSAGTDIWQHISKIKSGIYPFVVNTFGWIG